MATWRVHIVVAGVGWINPDEFRAIYRVFEGSLDVPSLPVVQHFTHNHRLIMNFTVLGDTMDEVTNHAHTLRHKAISQTGVAVPECIGFHVERTEIEE